MAADALRAHEQPEWVSWSRGRATCFHALETKAAVSLAP